MMTRDTPPYFVDIDPLPLPLYEPWPARPSWTELLWVGSDELAPTLFKWDPLARAWLSPYGLLFRPGDKSITRRDFSFGDPHTGLPTDPIMCFDVVAAATHLDPWVVDRLSSRR